MKLPTIVGTLVLILLGMMTYASAQEQDKWIAKAMGDGKYGWDEDRGVYRLHCREDGRCWRRYRDVRSYPRWYGSQAHDYAVSQAPDYSAMGEGNYGWDEARGVYRVVCREDGYCWRRYRDVRRYPRWHAWKSREYAERHELRKCHSSVRAVGEGAVTVAGAQRNAEKVWMGTVIFDFGQAYADPAKARNIDWLCSRASIRSVLGATLHKCALRATPCRPDVSHGRGDVKDDDDEQPARR